MTEDRLSWQYQLCRIVCRGVVEGVCGVQVEGIDNVRPRGRLIVAFNHRSLVDGPLEELLVSDIRRPISLAKEELFRNPAAGWFLRSLGLIPLDRHGGDVGGLRSALSVLEREGCLMLSPEGTRSRTGMPGRPKPGIGFLAHRSGAPVVPARVRNTEKFPSMTPMRVVFGRELYFDGGEGRASYQAFAQRVMDSIFKL